MVAHHIIPLEGHPPPAALHRAFFVYHLHFVLQLAPLGSHGGELIAEIGQHLDAPLVAFVYDRPQLAGGKFAQLEPVLALVPFFVQDERGNALFLQLVIASRQHVDVVSLDLGPAVDMERIVNVRLFGEGLYRRGLQAEAEGHGLIGVHAVRRVSRPCFGLAVQQTDAQDQLFAVPYQLHDPVRVFRLPVSAVFRIPAKAPFLIAQP